MKDKEEKKNEIETSKEQIFRQELSEEEMETVAAGVGPKYDPCKNTGYRY